MTVNKRQDERSGLLMRLMSLGARPANPPNAEGSPTGSRKRSGNGTVPAYRKNRRPYTVWHDEATIKQLKMLAAETGMTQQDLMVTAANDLFMKYGKPPIAI